MLQTPQKAVRARAAAAVTMPEARVAAPEYDTVKNIVPDWAPL